MTATNLTDGEFSSEDYRLGVTFIIGSTWSK